LQILDYKKLGAPIAVSVSTHQYQVKVIGSFTKPALWNPESLNLYEVVVSLKDGKKSIHQVKQRFGFRTMEVKQNDGIYINNKRIQFRGVCRHIFWPNSGRCSSKELSILDVSLMKDMNRMRCA